MLRLSRRVTVSQSRYLSQGNERQWEQSEQGRRWVEHCKTLGIDNPWKVLNLSPGADWEVVKESHRKLVFSLHPDKGGDIEEFRKVSEAFSLLKERRAGIENNNHTSDNREYDDFYNQYDVSGSTPPPDNEDWKYEDNPHRRQWYLRLKKQRARVRKLHEDFEADARNKELRSKILLCIVCLAGYIFLRPLVNPEWRDKRPEHWKT